MYEALPKAKGSHSSDGDTRRPREPEAAGSGGQGRPGSLPPSLPPARGGAPLLSRQAAVEGEAKFPCRSCLGELAGTLLPRGSQ